MLIKKYKNICIYGNNDKLIYVIYYVSKDRQAAWESPNNLRPLYTVRVSQ